MTERLWPELRVEADVADRCVDIVEVRPPRDCVGQYARFSITRLALQQRVWHDKIHLPR